MQNTVLVYFPHNPFPSRTGAHRRCVQMLDALVHLGARVHFASTNQFSDQPWTQEAISALRARGLEGVWLYQRFRGQGRLELCEARYMGADIRNFYSWWVRRWFSSLVDRLHPSTVVVHYAVADRLLNHVRYSKIYRIIEMHDLLTVNAQIHFGLNQREQHLKQTGQVGDLFDPNLQWAENLTPAPEELAIYDQYNAVIAIARREQLILQRYLRHARVEWIPMHVPAVKFKNSYDGPPIFLASGNKFNQVGLLLLLSEVLGRVIAKCPDFQIDIAGDISQVAVPWPNVRYLGYVPDLMDVCQKAAFAICPVFAGTGQQAKVIEAMAHGLPVVAFRRTAAESPLQHGENGLIAEDTDEFALHLATLWRNRDLCRQLGAAARTLLDNADNTAVTLRRLVPNL
jgi:glycosyltransferase involved in cell wall biosynthesis